MYMDKISEERIEALHPKVKDIFRTTYNKINNEIFKDSYVKCRVACTLRSPKQQHQLYEQGRTIAGRVVTNADSWQSYHQYGLAIDLVLLVDKDHNGSYESISYDKKADNNLDSLTDWNQILEEFRKVGFELGKDFRKFSEYPHIQMRFNYRWSELSEMVKQNLIDEDGYVII